MMIDFASGTVECDLPAPIVGGYVCDMDENGEVQFQFAKWAKFVGSWESKFQVKALSPHLLQFSGNPSKFLQGHNLYGSADIHDVLRRCLSSVLTKHFGQNHYVDWSTCELTRVDVASGFVLDRSDDVDNVLRGFEQSASCAYKGRASLIESTAYIGHAKKGGRAKDWQIVAYHKGKESAKNGLPAPMRVDPEVLEWVNRLLRVEVRLRSRELKKLDLSALSNWTDASASEIWKGKWEMVELTDARNVRADELAHLKPRLVNAYNAWLGGADLSWNLKRSTFYKLRKELKNALGVDVTVPCPQSNVVPLIREVRLIQASRPPWADRMDSLLVA